jgi:Zn-finger nucleic acid-binding protein
MPCPVCSATMQNLGAATDRIFWCPRCGCVLLNFGGVDNFSQTRLSRDVAVAADAAGTIPKHSTINYYTVPRYLWENICCAIGRSPDHAT